MDLRVNLDTIKQGNVKEFQILFEFLFPKLMALACRFVDEYIAKDMVQDAFISFWEKKEQIDSGAIQSYLYRSVQHNCLNYIKHQLVVEDYESKVRIAEERIKFESSFDDNEVAKMIENKDLRSFIESTLSKLPPRCKEAFLLCYFHDLTYKEVAQVMNISYRTVEVHVQKALVFLKENMLLIICLYIYFSFT